MFNKNIICCYLYPITKYGYPPPADGTLRYMDEMKKLGFSSIELEGIRDQHLLSIYSMRHKIKSTLDDLQLTLPFFCAVLPGLTSLKEKVRNENMELFRKGCEIAQLFGSHGILDNAPLPPYVFPDDIPVVRHYGEESLQKAYFPTGFRWDYYWDILIDTLRTACGIASEYGLTYQIHPASGVLSGTADGFLHLFDHVKKDNLRFNLDTANLFAVKENLPLALYRLHEHIDYIHISDNRGERVEHLAIGDGTIAWEKFFETLKTLNFKGYFGVDIGGSESNIVNLSRSYIETASWLEKIWFSKR